VIPYGWPLLACEKEVGGQRARVKRFGQKSELLFFIFAFCFARV
jgi:hypothetical protein